MAATHRLEICVLGALEVRRDGEPIALPQSRKARALLAYLALTGRSHTRSRLCELFWEDADDPRAGLRWCLSKLRGAVDDGDHQVIRADRTNVSISPDGVRIDVADVAARVESGPAQIDTAELRRLVEVFRGELLEGLEFSDLHAVQAWCVAERGEARALHVRLLTELADRLEREPEQALPFARALVHLEPRRDDARARLVRLLMLAGQRRQAEEQYRTGLRDLESAGASTHALRVEWRKASAGPAEAPGALAQLPESSFVGRDADMARLTAVLGRVARGQGCSIAIAGEAGVGKSRLAKEISKYARDQNMVVLSGSCMSAEGAPPYLPFIEALDAAAAGIPAGQMSAETRLLARILPGLAQRLGADVSGATEDDSDRYAMFRAASAVLDRLAGAAGLLLVVEDLHWADTQSLLMLGHLARHAVDSRVAVLCTYREGESSASDPLPETLAAIKRERNHERLVLERLDDAASRQLIARLVDVSDASANAILRQTEGLPLFIEEVVKHLVEEGRLGGDEIEGGAFAEVGLPEGVREVVSRRLSRLSEPCRRMLSSASACVGPIPWPVLVAVCPQDEDELLDLLDEALAARIIGERHGARSGSYEFTHSLIRQSLYEGLSVPRRARLHHKLAMAIESVYADSVDSHLDELASHYCEVAASGQLDRFLEYSMRAAERAMQLMAFEEAARLCRRALDVLDELDDSARRDARSRLNALAGGALSMLAQWSEARSQFERALELESGDPERRARLLLRRALSQFWTLDIAGLQESVDEAGRLVEGSEDKELRAASIAFRSHAASASGDVEGTRERFEEALALGEPSRDPLFAQSLQMYPLVLCWASEYERAIETGRSLITAARSSSNGSMLMNVLPMVAMALGASGRYRDSDEMSAEARRFGTERNIGRLLFRSMCMSVSTLLDIYDFEGAEARAAEAFIGARGLDFMPTRVSAQLDQLLIALARGDFGGAQASMPKIRAVVAEGAGWHGWVWLTRLRLAEAQLAAGLGKFDEAVDFAGQTIEMSLRSSRPKHRVGGLVARAAALVGLDKRSDAVESLREALAVVRGLSYPARFVRVASELLALEPDDELAKQARETASAIAEQLDGERKKRFESSPIVARLRG